VTEVRRYPRALVTGATGAIGPSVVHALHQAGWHVRTFSLDAPAPGTFPDGVEVFRGDVTDLAAVQTAVHGVDSVIHLAALLHILTPSPDLHERYSSVNIGGTATVAEASLKAGARRVLLFSTIAVYGYAHTTGQILDENSFPQPDTFYGQTKLAAEHIILNAKGDNGQPLGVVLRLGAVYGSRIKGNYRRLVHALARKRFVPIGKGANRRTLVHDKDVIRATLLAIKHPAALGRIYNVTDGQFHTVAQIINAICIALGRKPPRFSIPIGPVKLAAGALEHAARLVGWSTPVNRATVEKYTEDVAVEGLRIQTELGFRPENDLQTAWRETIREMRERGDL
jgi:nucleoside-diphosphate-sugar epimerase